MRTICGAIIGTAVAYYYGDVDPGSADLGLYGFNGVLTAVSVFVVCGGKHRLSILGAPGKGKTPQDGSGPGRS